jgi:GNAT superfamily N-acetyltransferase
MVVIHFLKNEFKELPSNPSPGPHTTSAGETQPEGQLTMPTRSASTAGTRIAFRYDVAPSDMQTVAEIVASTGFFNPAEVEIAVELLEDRLEFGDASGYFFVFAEQAGQVLGYTCYGPIAGTDGSFDLYWIANHHDHQARGLGRVLMQETERLIRDCGGRRLYAETSGRPQYEPTRVFYERLGFFRETHLQDFYAPGDDKVFFVKVL